MAGNFMTDEQDLISFSTESYEKRLIIFIDILGFKNFIDENKSSAGVDLIKEITIHFQEKCSEGHMTLTRCYKETFNFFSDTIIITLPFYLFNAGVIPEVNINVDNLRYLHLISIYTADIQNHLLKYGLLSRGCVHIGDIYHNKNTWFGPGLVEAHEHESKLAIYPRVIFTKTAAAHFQVELDKSHAREFPKDPFDGRYYVNPFSWIHCHFDGEFAEALDSAKLIIIKNLDELNECNKTKALEKWIWIAKYFNYFVNSEWMKTVHGDTLPKKIDLTKFKKSRFNKLISAFGKWINSKNNPLRRLIKTTTS